MRIWKLLIFCHLKERKEFFKVLSLQGRDGYVRLELRKKKGGWMLGCFSAFSTNLLEENVVDIDGLYLD